MVEQDLSGRPAISKLNSTTPVQGTQGTGGTGKMAKKIPVRENTGNLEILPKRTGNLVCSSCKFPDSNGKRYFNICRENSPKMPSPSQFCVCNSHKSRKIA